MPFPMVPFDMAWAGCTEYIPRRNSRARGRCGRSAQDEARNWRACGRVLGRAGLAQ